MDHEMTSDLMTSEGVVMEDVEAFGQSWAVNREKCAGASNKAVIPRQPAKEILEECLSLFQAKSSHFSPCYGRVSSFFR